MGVRWQRLPQAGQEIGGSGPAVLRQAGQGGQLPGWDVPGLRQPAGPGVGGQLYLPKSWTSDQDRCAAAGVPEDRRNYRSKTELALEMQRVLELGYLRAEWVAGDDAFGMSRPSGRDWRPWGCATCWTFRAALRSGPWTRLGPVRNIRSAAPANPSCGLGSGGPWSSAVMNCRMRLGGR